MSKSKLARAVFSALYKSNRAFAIFFVIYTSVAIFLLLLGLGSALAAASSAVHDAFREWGQSAGVLAPLWRGMALASRISESAGQIALDYLLSALNIGFGIFLVWRRPGDWVARLLGVGMVGTAMAFNYQSHGVLIVMLGYPNTLHFILHAISGATYVHALLLFPNGKLVPRGSVWLLAVIYLLMGTVIVLSFPLSAGPVAVGVSQSGFARIFSAEAVFFLLLFGLLIPIVGVPSQVHRYRTVATAQERQQTRPVVWALSLSFGTALLFLLLAVGLNAARGPAFSAERLEQLQEAVFRIFPPLLAVVPIALLVSILRYRLFDIDRVVNRTLVYGALTGMVIGVYMLVVGALGALFRASDNLLLSILATGLVAVLFQPLRQRLQRGVNRLMYGERDDPVAVLSRLGKRLEAAIAPDAALPTIVETVAQALKLPYAAIALKQGEDFKIAAAYGHVVDDPIKLPLVYQAETIGELILAPRAPGEEFSRSDQRLLSNIARQAGAAARAVRLTAELQRSRERLVTGREEERRRLRRDLHDGLGPTLASQALKLDAALDLLESEPAAASALLVELKTQIQATLADIRRLVYKLRPPVLDELSLVAAVRAHADGVTGDANRSPGLHITVEAPSQGLPPLPAAVEVAAYRIVLEALTNTARHAQAQHCVIRLSLDEAPKRVRMLHLEISDDGRGLPEDYRVGVGLNSMRERAEELGGTWEIEPAPGGGTCVCARLPWARET